MNFDDIYREYYNKILNFCYLKLENKQLAEDCTQEVFLALANKMHSLKLDTNVGVWLYKSAKLEILRCRKKYRDHVPIEQIENIPQEFDNLENFLCDIITEDEYQTLNDFFVNGEDVKKLANAKNMSQSAMYQRIYRIKQKIIQNSDKLHKFLNG